MLMALSLVLIIWMPEDSDDKPEEKFTPDNEAEAEIEKI
jgi:hypothetical protein